MRVTKPLLGFLPLMLLMASATIPAAPRETLRTELEVQVEVSSSLEVAPETDRRRLKGSLEGVVLRLGDIGYRFYPVLAADYAERYTRPEHVLSVQLASVDAAYERVSVQETEEAVKPRSVQCVAHCTLQRRRKDAPPLLVAIGRGNGSQSINRSPGSGRNAAITLKDRDAKTLAVEESDLLAAFEIATTQCLVELLSAIDRVLAIKKGTQRSLEGKE